MSPTLKFLRVRNFLVAPSSGVMSQTSQTGVAGTGLNVILLVLLRSVIKLCKLGRLEKEEVS